MNSFVHMTSIEATYKPQNGQSFRCSKNIPNWNTPKTGTLKFVVNVPDGYPQPEFAIDHDKVGSDTRWYSQLSNELQIDINSGEGGPGGHALYIGTTSPLPSDLDGRQTYKIDIYVLEGSVVPNPPGYRRLTAVLATYKPQGSQSFRCSDNFPTWDTPVKGTIKFVVNVPPEYPQPSFAIDHDKRGADTRWYSNISDEAEIYSDSENGEPGGHALYIGTTSDLPSNLNGSKQYLVTVFVFDNNQLPEISFTDAEKLALMHRYSPYIYMDKDELYLPSTVEYAFPYMTRYLNDDDKRYWIRTTENLDDASSILPYFHGDLDNAKVYAFWVNKFRSYKEITYFIFYPFNYGKKVFGTLYGNHVGDWEHITVRFSSIYKNGTWITLPIAIHLSAHSGGNNKTWSSAPLKGTSPIVYSAFGSHAMYFEPGEHRYQFIPLGQSLIDKCSPGKPLDCSLPGKILAFDFATKRGLDNNPWPTWMSDNYTDGGPSPSDPSSGAIYRWGNTQRECTKFACTLENGPTGPIDKGEVWDPNVLE